MPHVYLRGKKNDSEFGYLLFQRSNRLPGVRYPNRANFNDVPRFLTRDVQFFFFCLAAVLFFHAIKDDTATTIGIEQDIVFTYFAK